MRLIDADKTVHYQTYDDEHEEYREHTSTIAEFLDTMTDEGCPEAVDAVTVQKRGKWERKWSRPGVYADLYWHCTACGGYTDMQFAHVVYKFCPFCGATMERGTDE